MMRALRQAPRVRHTLEVGGRKFLILSFSAVGGGFQWPGFRAQGPENGNTFSMVILKSAAPGEQPGRFAAWQWCHANSIPLIQKRMNGAPMMSPV